jgi:hypothetical protein
LCIIVYKPENAKLTDETLYNCFITNSDGAGFMAWDSTKNELVMQKGFFSARSLSEAFEPYQNCRSILHFRIGTHGLKDTPNCHPFIIREGLGFVHNGIIQTPEIHKEFSDTWHFNQSLQRYLKTYPTAWEIDQFGALLGSLVHTLGWSKLAFMDNFGNVKIHGEKQGVWDEGCWFSNHSYNFYSAYAWGDYGDEIDYTGCGIYDGMGRYGGKYRATKKYPYIDDSEADTVEFKLVDDKDKCVNKHLYPNEVCPVCQNEYTNYYTKWSEDLQTFVCADCSIRLQDIIDYDAIDSRVQETEPINALLLEELFSKELQESANKALERAVECCEACGKIMDSFLYCPEENMWLCDECAKEAENKTMVI